jgi:hypothetical protein
MLLARRICSRTVVVAVLLNAGIALLLPAQPAVGQQPAHREGNKALHIQLREAQGKEIASAKISAGRPSAAVLSIQHAYQPGDRLVFGGAKWMLLQVDDSIPECLIYAPEGTSRELSYEIPFGREEKQTGSAYAPESFTGESHRVALRVPSRRELTGYRNLALNPCDLMRSDDAQVQFYPHASSNSVSRSLFDFEARNAIDGRIENGHHGVWPYQSWGPQLRTDIWWKVDFGRPVDLDKIRLIVRADFPHDSYWKSADVEFSDGSRVPLVIRPSPDFQDFSFSRRRVSWARFTSVVPADPTKWCSVIEVEAWGRDPR